MPKDLIPEPCLPQMRYANSRQAEEPRSLRLVRQRRGWFEQRCTDETQEEKASSCEGSRGFGEGSHDQPRGHPGREEYREPTGC